MIESIVIQIVNTIFTITISVALLTLYKKKKLNIVQVILISYATQGYSLSYVGPTITSFFLISFYFLFEVLISIICKPIIIKKKYLLLMVLPAFSSVWAIGVYLFSENSFYYIPTSSFFFFTKPIFFYIKNFLPFFTLAYKFYQDRDIVSVEDIYTTIKIISIYSCFWALLQLGICMITNSPFLLELIGNKPVYMSPLPNGLPFARVSALFMEPKYLAAFLGLSLPLFLFSKDFKNSILVFGVGVLTMSQTFTIECLIALIVFVILKNINRVRSIIIITISGLVLFFVTLSGLKDIIIQLALEYKDNIVFTLLTKRIVGRYDGSLLGLPKAEILGLPFQRDLELPVVLFLIDHPAVVFTGYGPGNSNFLPPEYFEDLPWIYEKQLSGTRANHMNMRWVFFVSEFGLIIFIFFFWILTSIRTTKFTILFYSYLWLCLFFNEVEIFIIMFYILIIYGKNINKDLEIN